MSWFRSSPKDRAFASPPRPRPPRWGLVAIGLVAFPHLACPDAPDAAQAVDDTTAPGGVDTIPAVGPDAAAGAAPDTLGGPTDGNPGGAPDGAEPGAPTGVGCDGLACPPGTACSEGLCVPAGDPPCLGNATNALVPAFARQSRDVLLHRGHAWVATALGLEVYDGSGAVVPVSPVAWVATPGAARGLALDGDRLAVAHAVGVTLFDATVPQEPAVHGTVATPPASGVALAGPLLLVATEGGLVVADADGPAVIATLPLPGPARSVVSRGAVAWVAVGAVGIAVVDVSTPEAPALLATLDTGGEAVAVTASGDLLLVAATYGGLRLFDISAPSSPAPLGFWVSPGNGLVARDVVLGADGLAFVAASYFHSLQVLDVSDPTAPVPVGTVDTGSGADGIAIAGDLVWLAAGGLERVDVSDPAAPVVLETAPPALSGQFASAAGDDALIAVAGTAGLLLLDAPAGEQPAIIAKLPTEHPALAVDLAGDVAWVALDLTYPFVLAGDLVAVDVSNPGVPALLGTAALQGRPARVRAAGDVVYVTDGALHAVDAADPTAPIIASTVSLGSGAEGLAHDGDLLLVARRYHGVHVFDVSERLAPVLRAEIATPGSALDVALQGTVACIADGIGGLRVLDLADPAAPIEVAVVDLPTSASSVALDGPTAWLVAGADVRVFDLQVPRHPTPILTAPTITGVPAALVALPGGALLTELDLPVSRFTLSCEAQP